MKRFALKHAAAVSLLLALCAGGGLAASAKAAGNKNILLVTIDTLRADRLSCYDPKYAKTPVMDRIAARGSRFERAFAHTPLTLPSHVDILTGLLPLQHGINENAKTKLDARFLTLAEFLKAEGYATGAFVGAFPLDSRFGLDQGFDVYDDAFSPSTQKGATSERRASDVAAAARAWLSRQKGSWFCWVHFWDPHAPYSPPAPFAASYASDPYSGEAAYVDAELGRILDDLKAQGKEAETVVVLTSDHGEALGEHGEATHGYFAYNSTLHVPLIIAGPGIGAALVKDPVGHVDLFPTVCDLLGFNPPAGLPGRSLVPAAAGRPFPPRPIYFESLEPYYSLGCAPQRGIIDGGKKFIDSPIPELYDLAADFKESSNLTPPADLSPFRARLAEIMKGASPAASDRNRKVDREALARLRSLGYMAGAELPRKTSFGPEDDLKTFLRFQQKLERGISLQDLGRYDEGARELESLISERKEFVWAYIFLAENYTGRKLTSDAVRTLEAGVRANPESYTLLMACGALLINTGDLTSAIGVFEKALSLIETDPEAWTNLGFILWRKGDFKTAAEYYDKAIALDPSFIPAFVNLGMLRMTAFAERGRAAQDLSSALDSFRKAVALDPSVALAWRGLGYALKESGKTAEAVAAWEKAIALNPADAFTAPNLASAYLEAGQKAKARTVLERFLAARGAGISAAERTRIQELLDKTKRPD